MNTWDSETSYGGKLFNPCRVVLTYVKGAYNAQISRGGYHSGGYGTNNHVIILNTHNQQLNFEVGGGSCKQKNLYPCIHTKKRFKPRGGVSKRI